MTHALTCTSAAFGYTDTPLVKDFDLTVEQGEALLVLGCNGSGKSTLVRGVLGLVNHMGGEVSIFDQPHRSKAAKARVGYVPQRHTAGSPIPSTVRDVVRSGLVATSPILRPLPRDAKNKVARAIAAVGLQDKATEQVADLSGGQQRRVLIARALVTDPDLLLMDEPTAGVDAESQEALIDTLTELHAGGITLVVVSHDLAPLRRIAGRSITLHHGRKIQDGPAVHAVHAADAPTHEECCALPQEPSAVAKGTSS